MENLAGNQLDQFRSDANQAICFRMIRNKADLKSGPNFHPDFTHQVFGESEQIFGYKDLKVNIWYLAGSLSTYIDISYSSRIQKKIAVAPDDIMDILLPIYEYKIDHNLEDFTATFQADSFTPFGTLRRTYLASDGFTSKYCVYFIEHGMSDFDGFLEYHKKMESFLLFYVDGASTISSSDPQWCYYTLYELDDCVENKAPKYSFIGYMTVYKFYAYPENLRPRLSQVLILPPYRNKGHATELLRTFYRDFVHVPNVRDIAVEDPSPEFQRLRDFLDCKRCLKQPEVMEIMHTVAANGTESSPLKRGPNYAAFCDKVQKYLKINKFQAKRIFEVLQLYLLPRTPDALQLFRNALCKRIQLCYKHSSKRNIQETANEKAVDSFGKNIASITDECFESQLNERVDVELNAYVALVVKLDQYRDSVKTKPQKLPSSNENSGDG